MNPEYSIQPDALVADILNRFPGTASVFLQFKLGCIGCSMACFCTLADVAQDYELDLSHFLQALQNSIHSIQA